MLINYGGKYYDMSTVAHELGHACTAFHSNRAQPFHLAGYETFVAEVASQFNEDLLMEYILKQVTDRDARIAVLGNYLETLKATVLQADTVCGFRAADSSTGATRQAADGPSIAKLYLDITRKYYGHDQGVCIVDDYIAHEWSGVPHFYSSYTSSSTQRRSHAATALSEGVLTPGAHGGAATTRYIQFLSAGGSKYPIDLLKDAGVDMNDRPAARADGAKDESGDDEIEKLLGK
jgi:oligoendopeptidase F